MHLDRQTLCIVCFFSSQFQLAVVCDENEQHTAVLYCITCSTNLCLECSELTHSTRTLNKHKRVPLSEKPKEIPKCQYHPMHLVEFVCQEQECQNSPLMCYICKDYGRHMKHKVSIIYHVYYKVLSVQNKSSFHCGRLWFTLELPLSVLYTNILSNYW